MNIIVPAYATLHNDFCGNPDYAYLLLGYIAYKSKGKPVRISAQTLKFLGGKKYAYYIKQLVKKRWLHINHSYAAFNDKKYRKTYTCKLPGETTEYAIRSTTCLKHVRSRLEHLEHILAKQNSGDDDMQTNNIEALSAAQQYERYCIKKMKVMLELEEARALYAAVVVAEEGERKYYNAVSSRTGKNTFEEHGRVYHWLSTLPSESRQYIYCETPDDKLEKMQELDVKSCLPWIWKNTLKLEEIEHTTVYEQLAKMIYDITSNELTREQAKIAFQKLINSEDKHKLLNWLEPHMHNYPVGKFILKIRATGTTGTERFRAYGKKEGQLIERTRELLMKEGIIFYTVHDCVGVPVSRYKDASSAMKRAAEEIFGKNNGLVIN